MKKEERDKYDQTYGIFKFKVPLPSELESAMGLAGESILFKKMISKKYEQFYDTIKAPDIGDWLMNHKEYGQTYTEYIRSGIVQVEPNRDSIYIAPLSFNPNEIMDQDFITNVYLFCEAYFYGMKVRLIEINSDFNDVERQTHQDGSMQINAEKFMCKLSREIPEDAFCLIGLLDTDLYSETMEKNGKLIIKSIYGVNSLPKRTSVLSFAKYDPLFNSNKQLKDLTKEQKLKLYVFLMKRVCKAIVKDICHMFGMKNCTFFSCNMNGFGSIEEFDSRPIELCPICLRKLITNINSKGDSKPNARMKNAYAAYDRFVKLRDMVQENGYGIFENEVSWFNARIDSLKNDL